MVLEFSEPQRWYPTILLVGVGVPGTNVPSHNGGILVIMQQGLSPDRTQRPMPHSSQTSQLSKPFCFISHAVSDIEEQKQQTH